MNLGSGCGLEGGSEGNKRRSVGGRYDLNTLYSRMKLWKNI